MSEHLSLTHGCSLSNLPLFVADGAGLFAEQGLLVEAPVFSRMSSTAEALASGAADLGTVSFIQPLIDSARLNPPVMVAGSGLMGIALLAQPGTTCLADLKGRSVGTFRGDPLEVLLHDALAGSGLGMADVDLLYLDDIAGAMESFAGGKLAGITLAEPHATRLRASGAVTLSDGRELWGDPFPDTVLVASARLLTDRPKVVRSALRAMIKAEKLIADDPVAAIEHAARHYPGYRRAELSEAAQRQPPCVDIRGLVPTVLNRWSSLQSLRLVSLTSTPPHEAIRLDFLNEELGPFPPVGPARSTSDKEPAHG